MWLWWLLATLAVWFYLCVIICIFMANSKDYEDYEEYFRDLYND